MTFTITDQDVELLLENRNIHKSSKSNSLINLVIRLLNDTGMRIDEILALKRKDLNINTRLVTVRAPNQSIDRFTFISKSTQAYIKKIHDECLNCTLALQRDHDEFTVQSTTQRINALALTNGIKKSLGNVAWRWRYHSRIFKLRDSTQDTLIQKYLVEGLHSSIKEFPSKKEMCSLRDYYDSTIYSVK